MRTFPRTTGLAASACVALTMAVLTGSSTQSASAASALPVTGYQSEGDPSSLIDASAPGLGSVGVDGVNITADGQSVAAPSSDAQAQLARAHADGLPASFLIGNFSAGLGDFDEPAAYRLLSSPANIDRVVAALRDAVVAQGWDGVTIDLESLQARDRSGLTDFAAALKASLPAGAVVSIDVTAFESLSDYNANGYDLQALGQTVDNLALMAYDEHGFGTGPGPVGELSWQASGLDVVLSQVDPGKVDLGVAGYGYAFAPDGGVTQVSDQGARDTVAGDGATATFDTNAGEWTATLSDGTVLWWSDAKSRASREQLAADRGIHGLAVWDLGLSDTIEP
jgi:spore germination protein